MIIAQLIDKELITAGYGISGILHRILWTIITTRTYKFPSSNSALYVKAKVIGLCIFFYSSADNQQANHSVITVIPGQHTSYFWSGFITYTKCGSSAQVSEMTIYLYLLKQVLWPRTFNKQILL